MSYYILDRCGNFIAEYETFRQIEEAYNAPYSAFCNCARYISALVNGKKPTCKKRLATRDMICVKKEDYINHLNEIIWILTKKDVLIINKSGNIVGTYKNAFAAAKSLDDKALKSGVRKALNKASKQYLNHRFATREHYIEMIKQDPLYYVKEHKDNSKKYKISVDMYNIKTGDFIKGFESYTEAAKYMGCSIERIRQAIKNGNPVLKTDYYFKIRNEN